MKCNVWMFVKPNTSPNTRLSKWVLETISTVLLSYVKFKRYMFVKPNSNPKTHTSFQMGLEDHFNLTPF